MPTLKQIGLATALLFTSFSIVPAQQSSIPLPQKPSLTITATATGDRVRITAPASVVQLRIEVYGASGEKIFDQEIRGGNVFDWRLQDGQAQRLAAGAYVCVVTARSISGRLTQKLGTVKVEENSVSLQAGDQRQLSPQQAQTIGPLEEDSSWTLTEKENETPVVIAHDGADGQLTRGRGALSFRLGDFFSGMDQEQMRLTEKGNLGIGTSTPQAKLDVAGDIRAAGVVRAQGIEFADGTMQTTGISGHKDAQGNVVPAASGAGTANRIAKWIDGSGTLGDSLWSESGSNVVNNGASIQMTAAPSTTVDTNLIFVNANDRTTGMIASSTPSFTSFNGPYFAMRGNTYNTFTGQRGLFAISAGNVSSPTGREGSVIFNTGADQIRMIVSSSGNVGVGTTTPQARLDVAGDMLVSGNATISGNIAAKYQDIAEWTPARGELPAGTVVSLDTLRRNSVMPSNRAYDTRVAGVVSAKPGVILGEPGANKVLVATTGRVKVRVNAGSHPIQIGDLLVASNLPGIAMRSQPFRLHGRTMHLPGTIIGKALEPLTRGQGEILVLLSLQ